MVVIDLYATHEVLVISDPIVQRYLAFDSVKKKHEEVTYAYSGFGLLYTTCN